jgi:hypothetical protein
MLQAISLAWVAFALLGAARLASAQQIHLPPSDSLASGQAEAVERRSTKDESAAQYKRHPDCSGWRRRQWFRPGLTPRLA